MNSSFSSKALEEMTSLSRAMESSRIVHGDNSRSKWIWIRFDVQKKIELEYIDARHFHTAKDILDRWHMENCVLKLYDANGRELEPQETVLALREYTVKRFPKQ